MVYVRQNLNQAVTGDLSGKRRRSGLDIQVAADTLGTCDHPAQKAEERQLADHDKASNKEISAWRSAVERYIAPQELENTRNRLPGALLNSPV